MMTFAELVTTLDARHALTPSRVKDVKTGLRYLAKALGYDGLEDASLDDACRNPTRWLAALEARFATLAKAGQAVGAYSQKSARNHLRYVFRVAEAEGLLTAPLPSRLLTRPNRSAWRLQQRATTPYPPAYTPRRGETYYLPQAQWPPDIVQGWEAYKTRCGVLR